MLYDQLVRDGNGGKDLFWRRPVEMSGRKKIMREEKLKTLPVSENLYL